MSDSTPAGWYPAPHANNELRYWDGATWNDQVPPPAGATPVATIESPVVVAPVGPAGPSQQGLAIGALIAGIVAFLTGLVPFLGLFVALAAMVLGILALRRNQQKVFSYVGLTLGGIALITGLIVAMLFGIAASKPSSVTSSGQNVAAPAETEPEEAAEATPAPAESPAQTQAASPAPVEQPAPVQPAPAPAADLGSAANPYPQPYVAKGFFGGEKYSLSGTIVDANANGLVEEWNMFNGDAPAGFKYVVVQLTMTGIDPDGVEPNLAEFDLSLATAEGNKYDREFVIFGDGMPAMSDGPTLYPGSSFTGYTAYIVPDSAQSFLLYDNRNYVALS